MAQLSMHDRKSAVLAADRDKALKIFAKSIFKQLKTQGYDSKQIISLATELIAQVTTDLQNDPHTQD
jgi:hypothetical protein